ncbi:hypothetical protein TSAR_012153 [Trichomalopsis sarcophagae]|uniref:Uncharacterized protein n=1 Tax=Trichomalopsis sarcophagae TaxID=543379 RepID=A0A232FKI7_9HYME|nr:hypothetical protein TSAR_012153 [Trichomalopsis sarcophagae]
MQGQGNAQPRSSVQVNVMKIKEKAEKQVQRWLDLLTQRTRDLLKNTESLLNATGCIYKGSAAAAAAVLLLLPSLPVEQPNPHLQREAAAALLMQPNLHSQREAALLEQLNLQQEAATLVEQLNRHREPTPSRLAINK